MARPQSNTVEYFSHDTDASEKKTVGIMLEEFGLTGSGFWWILLEKLGSANNHYLDLRNPIDMEFLLRKWGLSVVSGTEMLDKLAYLGGIDPVLWSHGIVWSQNFVNRLSDVYKKRNRLPPEKPCFCDDNCNHSSLKGVISGTKTPVLGSGIPQKIIKDIKGNIIRDDISLSSSTVVNNELSDILSLYETNIGSATPDLEKLIKKACEDYSQIWVTDAILSTIGKSQEKRNWSYISGILKNWAREGLPAEAEITHGDNSQPRVSVEGDPEPAAQAHWNKALAELEKEVARANFNTWYAKTIGYSFQKGMFIVKTPNKFIAEYLEKNARSIVSRVLTGITGESVNVQFLW